MRKWSFIPGKLAGWVPTASAVMSALALALSIPMSVPAQDMGSEQSVDQSFSALHEALSVKATNLLVDAQRLPDAQPPPLSGSTSAAPRAEFALADESQNLHTHRSQKALERVKALQPLLEPILREEGVPTELTAVVLIESGGRTTALSPKGALGLWQFVPDTARRYGLIVTGAVDERLDPYKSTRAAARYLRDLYTQFGSWPLALAAYNSGEDTVQRAIDRISSRDFPSVSRAGALPAETRNYVPAVLNAMGAMKTGSASYVTAAFRPAGGSVIYASTEVEN